MSTRASAAAPLLSSLHAPVVTEINGDLFAAAEYGSMAHCVSRDLRMGKGISVIFKQRYGCMDELAKQNVGIGGVAVLDVTRNDGRPKNEKDKQYVYYLITKDKYYEKPTYATLTESLWAMRNHAEAHGVMTISMPRIGCGLDGLDWQTVKCLLENLFKDSRIKIHVYVL